MIPIHHFANNIFFARRGSGVVHFAAFEGNPSMNDVKRFFETGGAESPEIIKPIFQTHIDPDSWVSIIADMSLITDARGAHDRANALHWGKE